MVPTFKGTVINGQIQLRDDVTLPDNTTVYVLVPELDGAPKAHVHSPRLAHPHQAADFVKQVVKVPSDA